MRKKNSQTLRTSLLDGTEEFMGDSQLGHINMPQLICSLLLPQLLR